MCGLFDTTAMDKQMCFVLLSCLFATVYLQVQVPRGPSLVSVIDFVTYELQQRKEPLSLIHVWVYQQYRMMGDMHFLWQVTTKNTSNQESICTGIVRNQYNTEALTMDDIHCSSDKPGSPRIQLMKTNHLKKTIKKALDLLHKGSPYMIFGDSLKEVKVLVTGCFSAVAFFTFELTVQKSRYFTFPWLQAYDNPACKIGDKNVRLKYSVRGATGTSIDDPVVELRFLGEVNPTS